MRKIRLEFYCSGAFGKHVPGTQRFAMGRRRGDCVELPGGDFETAWHCSKCGSELWVLMERRDYYKMVFLLNFFKLLELTEFTERFK